jgi:hypothetical protein
MACGSALADVAGVSLGGDAAAVDEPRRDGVSMPAIEPITERFLRGWASSFESSGADVLAVSVPLVGCVRGSPGATDTHDAHALLLLSVEPRGVPCEAPLTSCVCPPGASSDATMGAALTESASCSSGVRMRAGAARSARAGMLSCTAKRNVLCVVFVFLERKVGLSFGSGVREPELTNMYIVPRCIACQLPP